MDEQVISEHRCGYVAIVGRPNVGKSTLLNRVLGQKISIVSRKPQTTRNRILGLHSEESAQAVFVDTPGIHEAKTPINRRMVSAAIAALQEVDLVLFMVDVTTRGGSPEGNAEVLQALSRSPRRCVLVLNKIDQLDKRELLPLLAEWSGAGPWEAMIPVSARTGNGVAALLLAVIERLPVAPAFFPKDQVTDLSERFLVSELIREKVIRNTGQELPYVTAVEIEEWEHKSADLVRIMARIWVERDGQKAIVIGKGGSKLKEIGTSARRDIERLLGARVYLQLTVGVKEGWTHDRRLLDTLGHFGEGNQ